MNITESVKIEKEVLDEVRKFCKIHGLKLTWFISRTIEDTLGRIKPQTTGAGKK